jgi:cytochrome c oxidase subunit II
VRRRTASLVLAALGLCLALAPGALAGNAGFGPPTSATDSGKEINELYWILIGILAVVFVLVEGAVIWFVLRFRRRRGQPEDAEGPQIHGNTRLEIVWTAIPLAILVALMVVTIVKVPSVEAKPGPDDDPLIVRVGGHQFYWEYGYENGVVQVDRLRIPVDRPVQLVLDAYDVIHSWWVPELTGKRDTIPGRTNTLSFTARRVGVYEGQCAELCGVQHTVMRTEVEVVPAAEFDAWLAAEQEAQAAVSTELGRQTWEGVCAKCHGLDGQGDYGPVIAGNSLLADKANLAQLLAEGQDNPQIDGYMPAVSQDWPEAQLDALLAYLQESGLAPQAPAEQGG